LAIEIWWLTSQLQISGARYRISGFPLRQLRIRRRILRCTFHFVSFHFGNNSLFSIHCDRRVKFTVAHWLVCGLRSKFCVPRYSHTLTAANLSCVSGAMANMNNEHSISGPMTVALVCYSSVFMRYALAVTPKNYLLFGCHIINFSAQLTQGYRYLNYWKYVGRSSVPIAAI